jgi:hypothetical protein
VYSWVTIDGDVSSVGNLYLTIGGGRRVLPPLPSFAGSFHAVVSISGVAGGSLLVGASVSMSAGSITANAEFLSTKYCQPVSENNSPSASEIGLSAAVKCQHIRCSGVRVAQAAAMWS